MCAAYDNALARIVQRMPVARLRDVAEMADDLPGRADYPLNLDLEEIGIGVDPRGQTPAFVRIMIGERPHNCHDRRVPEQAALRKIAVDSTAPGGVSRQ